MGPLWSGSRMLPKTEGSVSCRTSSQLWSSWNLPRFLLRDGSLTIMNIASLMVLVMLCTSLPKYGETVHIDAMPWGTMMFINGERGPGMFFKLVTKGPSQSPNIFLFTTYQGALKPVDFPTYLGDSILILGTTRSLQVVLLLLNAPVLPLHCTPFWNLHQVPWYRVPQRCCSFLSCCHCQWFDRYCYE